MKMPSFPFRLLWPAMAVALALTGCTVPGTRAKRAGALHDSAESLLPAEADVVVREEGDCRTLARSPSCVSVWFVSGDLSLAERERRMRSTAEANGWQLVLEDRGPGGAGLSFKRGKFEASVNLLSQDRYARCLNSPERDCADSVRVQRT